MEQNFTSFKAPTLAITYDSSISSSTTVTFASGSTYIIVTALLKGIFMKWGGVASSSSFDEFIGPEKTEIYWIPTGVLTAQFLEEAASARLVVIEK